MNCIILSELYMYDKYIYILKDKRFHEKFNQGFFAKHFFYRLIQKDKVYSIMFIRQTYIHLSSISLFYISDRPPEIVGPEDKAKRYLTGCS